MNIQMQMPDRVIIEESASDFHSRFILSPLEPGFGVTLGNSMRRVLLSSIYGTAIVGVKISDVLHEFQSINGVVEDVTDIILNLKEVRFKLSDKKLTKINFSLKGPHVWTSKDIQDASSLIEVTDPNHYIATLSEDAEFDVELRIGRGKGYIPSEEQIINDFPVGMLPIDAIYTPIKNVVYSIEPYRVGQKTDYERLILDVRTDGSITAQEAVHQSAKILNEHVKYFISLDIIDDEEPIPVENPEDEAKNAEKNRIRKILLTPVDELELSVRAHNCLKIANIKTLSELVMLEEAELLKFRNFGRKSLTELQEVVASYGLDFGMNVDLYIKEDKAIIAE
ncbi:MAG TPA: DNA-directed RNA polymerase subunit alpha [Candidatus Kapabacteria bacterium]|nr:DNA-directed RNA polymerase subunit alpha [Candidatus Kapabacteria bacterium]